MNNQLNNNINMILNMANSNRNPKQIIEAMIQQNPQIRQMMTQIQNMAQGRTPQEFITQIAKQNGVGQEMIDKLLNIMCRK